MFDVVIIGGGAAGLSAGLTLGRFQRRVLIADGSQPRNAPAHGVHNFFSRDGTPPGELLQIARAQLEPYTTVAIRPLEVIAVQPHEQHFEVVFADGTHEQAQKILLATGVKDQLPPIAGLEALWGKSVFHCPYCHGWEARDQAIAILANGDGALHLASLLHSLSQDMVICTNGASEIADADVLNRRGIRIITTPIQHVTGIDGTLEGITFTDGTYLKRDVIFARPSQSQHSTLPAELGCTFTPNGHVQVDAQGRTSVAGVFAAGDLASPNQQVIAAAAAGAFAAAIINSELAQAAFI